MEWHFVMIVASSHLNIIAKHGVGYDTIDVQAAAGRRVPVTIAAGANAQSVAEHAFALMFSVARQTAWLDSRMRAGYWNKATAHGIRQARGSKLTTRANDAP